MRWHCEDCGELARQNKVACKHCGGRFKRSSLAARTAAKNLKSGLDSGRAGLLLVAVTELLVGFYLLFGVNLRYVAKPEVVQFTGLASMVLGFVFLAARSWLPRAPVTAAYTSLSVFVGLHVIGAVVDPATLFSGLLVKAFVVITLASVISCARTHERWKSAELAR